MLALFLCVVIGNSPFIHAARANDENEDLRKAFEDLQKALDEASQAAAEVAVASAELSQAEAEAHAMTNEAKAHALEWLLAYRNGPDWAPQSARAGEFPVTGDFMVMIAYKDACTNPETALEYRYGLCAKTWKSLTDLKNEDWNLHYILSEQADDFGEKDVAFVAGAMALELNPKDANVAYKVSYYALKAGRGEDAANIAALAMNLDMREEIVAETALVLAKTGSLGVGIALLEAAIALRPTSGVLLTEEGYLFAGGGRADLAESVLKRADAAGYAGADLQIAWGHTRMVQEKPAEALVYYRKAVALDPAMKSQVPPDLQGKL